MKSVFLTLLAITGLCLTPCTSPAQPAGEATFAAGAIFPQGDFSTYADIGLSLTARGVVYWPDSTTVRAWADLGFSFFTEETTRTEEFGSSLVPWSYRHTRQSAFSTHGGFQLATNKLLRGRIRLRLSSGPGLYVFSTSTSYSVAGEDDELNSNSVMLIRMGLRSIAGIDVLVSSKWGLSLDFVHDHVFRLHHNHDRSGSSRDADFLGAMIGIVIPMGKGCNSPDVEIESS